MSDTLASAAKRGSLSHVQSALAVPGQDINRSACGNNGRQPPWLDLQPFLTCFNLLHISSVHRIRRQRFSTSCQQAQRPEYSFTHTHLTFVLARPTISGSNYLQQTEALYALCSSGPTKMAARPCTMRCVCPLSISS